jgi:hypothetical protein
VSFESDIVMAFWFIGFDRVIRLISLIRNMRDITDITDTRIVVIYQSESGSYKVSNQSWVYSHGYFAYFGFLDY